jgi:uncharacterized protein YcfJ
MSAFFRTAMTLVASALAAQASAQVTFYENDNFQGRSFTTERQVTDFSRSGFNDRASSMVVVGERWEVCENLRFGGRCVVLRPGRYASLGVMSLNDRVSSTRPVARNVRVDDTRYAPAPVATQAVFYEHENFAGRTFTAERDIEDLGRYGFNDRASSVVVFGDRWEVCADNRFNGQCVVLLPGRYPSLSAMGLNDRVTSVRAVDWNSRVEEARHAPTPVPVYDNRRRNDERLFTADVTSVRAVVGVAGQRCWTERERVQTPDSPNVGAAVAGALIGGILGHQVGGGSGKDLATVGGAVAGAAVGVNVARNNASPQSSTQNVQRCVNEPSLARAAYWDVTYTFRGLQHQVQMTSAPGPTVSVNAQGEPRS